MPVMMPGSAIGRMNSSEIESRPKKRARDTAAAAQVPRTSAMSVAMAATFTESHSAFQMSCRVPDDGEPLRGVAGRRELIALLLGGEGIEEDQGQRQMQEQQAADGREGERQRRALRRVQSASKAPMRLAIHR